MLENLEFNLDGINSSDMGVSNVNVSTGLTSEMFLPPSNIVTQSVRGRDEPYLMDVRYDVISFSMDIYFDEGIDNNKLREVSRWIMGDNNKRYLPFYFLDGSDRMFYVRYDGEPRILHNGEEGYIQISFKTSAPYAFSKSIYHNSNTSHGFDIMFIENKGDRKVKPEIRIKKINSSGDISVINKTNGNKGFTLKNLNINEQVYIDCKEEDIESSLESDGIYRYDDFEGDFIEVAYGRNELELIGDFEVSIQFRNILIQG